MSLRRTLFWYASTWIIGVAVLFGIFWGLDGLLRDGFAKTALQWIIGAIVVTCIGGTGPARPSGTRSRR